MMRSDTNRFVSRPFRTSALVAAVASLALTSCAAQDNQTLALHRPAPYFALNVAPGPVAGATRHNGSFAEENGCIVFKSATSSSNLTPVFPKGQTVLVSDGWQAVGMYINGSPVSVRTPYGVRGAMRQAANHGIALASPAPAACPDTYFVVEDVAKDLRAETDVWPLCTSTLLCMGFRLR